MSLGLAACAAVLGIDHEYTERVADAGSSEDTGGGASDGAPDAIVTALQFRCGAVTVASCIGCDAGEFACASSRACVASCTTACPEAPVECEACDTAGAVARAECESKATASACTAPPNAYCSCDAAVDCPGARQTCVARECRACGDTATHGQNCAAGKKCDSDDAGPPQDETTCH